MKVWLKEPSSEGRMVTRKRRNLGKNRAALCGYWKWCWRGTAGSDDELEQESHEWQLVGRCWVADLWTYISFLAVLNDISFCSSLCFSLCNWLTRCCRLQVKGQDQCSFTSIPSLWTWYIRFETWMGCVLVSLWDYRLFLWTCCFSFRKGLAFIISKQLRKSLKVEDVIALTC